MFWQLLNMEIRKPGKRKMSLGWSRRSSVLGCRVMEWVSSDLKVRLISC